MCMNVSEICAEGIFVTFPWWLENVKSRSKIALFSNERHFEIWFPKKRTITFFWSKLSKLHKKDPILPVATTFSLKQGETRTSHGPIPLPLNWRTWRKPAEASLDWKPNVHTVLGLNWTRAHWCIAPGKNRYTTCFFLMVPLLHLLFVYVWKCFKQRRLGLLLC